ncbi:hypothetical protein AMJ40_07585, partial [candidate division TA06 bacterium DG_26]
MKVRSDAIVSAVLWVALLLCPPVSSEETGLGALDVASYQINVALDTEEKRLCGDEIVSFRNVSNIPLDALCMHLYPNAFRSERTTFMQGCPSWFRRLAARREQWGSMDITGIAIVDGQSLTDSISIDETVMSMSLPQSLLPGEQ